MTNSVTMVLRATAVLAVLMLALLGVLFVFDLIPRETLQDYSIKTLLLAAIVAGVGLVLAVLLKNGKSS